MERNITPPPQIGGEPFGQVDTDVSPAMQNLANCFRKFLWNAFLCEVTRCASPKRPARELLLGVHAKDQNWHCRAKRFYFFKDFKASPPGHADIQDDDIPFFLANMLQRFLRGARLAE